MERQQELAWLRDMGRVSKILNRYGLEPAKPRLAIQEERYSWPSEALLSLEAMPLKVQQQMMRVAARRDMAAANAALMALLATPFALTWKSIIQKMIDRGLPVKTAWMLSTLLLLIVILTLSSGRRIQVLQGGADTTLDVLLQTVGVEMEGALLQIA